MLGREVCVETMIPNALINPRGGILADDQGLGKSITIICLILTNLRPQRHNKLSRCSLKTICGHKNPQKSLFIKHAKKTCRDIPIPKLSNIFDGVESSVQYNQNPINTRLEVASPFGGTLIICPTTLISQWLKELQSKITRNKCFDLYIYHGDHRIRETSTLYKYEAVLTSYQVLTLEAQTIVKNEIPVHKGKKSSLFHVYWYRLVIDEAQNIKNAETLMYNAVRSLQALNRWCLTGTPMQNSMEDLFSYCQFLRFEPYCSLDLFKQLVENPIILYPRFGFNRLRMILGHILIRRTKRTN
jgi:SNF2 family DNA or RNA helicase